MAISVTESSGNTISVTVSGGTSTTFSTTSTSVSVTPPTQSTIDVKAQGPKGDKGETGPQGPAGIGPAGGTENQFVQKNSATDYDTKWSAYTLPAADGLSGQMLTTDGAGSVSFEYPLAIYENVKNVSGGPLVKGTPVHVTGSVGNLAEVIAADAATNYPAHFVLNEDLLDEGEGLAVALGFINNVDVPDASIYSEGQTVYLGASGGWSTTKPTGTNAIQNLGVIIKVNTSGNKISGIVMGAGRSNDVPNIPEGQAWIGNASGVATPTTLADVATSGAYSDLSGTPSIPVSGVDFDPAGTDNSTDVTLAGAYDYITIAGQTITTNQVDYTTDISNTPTIPSALGDLTGTSDNITEGTTNKFLTTAEETKLGFVSVTQAVDLDTMESDIATNNAKVSNVTTDLTTTHASSTVTVNSSDGTDATINGATTSLAGVMTGADKTKLDGIETSADVTDATNVTSSLVAATAISAGDKTTIQTNIGVDPAGTDNSTDVTLAGAYNYLTLSGQQITLDQVDYNTDISNTPSIPVSGVDFDPVGTDNSTDVTLAGAYNYLTLLGQQITLGQVDYNTDISNTPSIPVSGVDFDPVGTDNSTDATVGATASDVLKFAAGQVLGGFDAGADKLIFWDDSAGKLTYATIGTNLTMTDTTLAASGGGGSANMSQTFSAPTSVGEFQDGARLVTGAYGTAPAATAGTLVNFGNTAPSLVGAQSVATAATGMLTVVTDAASGDELLVEGVVKMSSNTGWSTAKKGAPLYMSTTAGQVTETAPSTAGEFVRVVGHVVDSSNSTIYFKPDNTWLEL